jgi:ABC-type nickel/cobalt efflux system permease component RcnA
MRSRFARLLLILTALWLPLQAVAGMTMKIVTPAMAPAVQDQVVEDACPYHRHTEAAAPEKSQPAQQHDCDSCGVCHLAATGYVHVAALAVAMVPTTNTLVAAPTKERASHIPEPPQYPPKRI